MNPPAEYLTDFVKGQAPTPIKYGARQDFNYVPIKIIPSDMCNRSLMMIPDDLLSVGDVVRSLGADDDSDA